LRMGPVALARIHRWLDVQRNTNFVSSFASSASVVAETLGRPAGSVYQTLGLFDF
jgi:hypothetical protein